MLSLLRRGLERASYAVDAVNCGEDALWMAQEFDYDCVVLDVGIPAPDGFAVCRALREAGNWVPVLLLTVRDAVNDRVTGLDAGADDYLTKPFAFDELLARIRSLTRRVPTSRPTVLVCGELRLDRATHVASRSNRNIDLSPKEFALLEFLMAHSGEVLSRTQIMEHVWDFDYDGTSNVIDVYVRYLRTKVDTNNDSSLIETVRGVGYRLTAEAQ